MDRSSKKQTGQNQTGKNLDRVAPMIPYPPPVLLNPTFLNEQARLNGRYGKIALFCDFVCLFVIVSILRQFTYV